jgi:hypothetical protein
MPRLTADQWAAIRIEWEGEPTATFSALAGKHNVNKSEISRTAKRQGWSKRGQLGDINEAAQRKADAQLNADGNPTQRQPNTGDLATRDESESLRAAVLVRLRAEWAELEGFRKAALAAMKTAHENGDKAAWSIAKMAADTALANIRALSVKQDAERKAWGLDAKSEEDIVITNPRRIEA